MDHQCDALINLPIHTIAAVPTALADLLAALDCTLAVSSCQAGKVVLLSPHPAALGDSTRRH